MKQTVDEEDYEMLEDNKYKEIQTYYKFGPSILLILDDINGTHAIQNDSDNPLLQIISNHRHLHLSVFILMQNYKKVPLAIRTLMKKYFLFYFGSKKQIETFYEEIAFSYFEDAKEFERLYRILTKGKNNFMLIDLDPKDERLAIRRNFVSSSFILFNISLSFFL